MSTNAQIYGFLSHKAKDKLKAEALRGLLTTSGGGKLDLFLSSTDIKGGEVWRNSILENMKKSSFLILLYLNPDDDWDWCLYETGYFRGANKGPVFCIHPQSSTIPAPLEDLQQVEAKPQVIKETFLKPLFSDVEDGFALNPTLFAQDNVGILDKLAGDIVKVVGSRPQFFPLLPRVIFSLTAAQMESARDTGKVPDDACIEFDPKSKVIFEID
ncbi:MAG: toll/interleukin-1 receptor domain-containing protein, partial [Phycisphaerales bacterium]